MRRRKKVKMKMRPMGVRMGRRSGRYGCVDGRSTHVLGMGSGSACGTTLRWIGSLGTEKEITW